MENQSTAQEFSQWARTHDASCSTEELERAAAWSRKFLRCGQASAEAILIFSATLLDGKRDLKNEHLWEKAVLDAGLTVAVANKHLRIAKSPWLYSDEMKPLLPYMDGYTTINKLAGFKPELVEELIESWKQEPRRITRKELTAIEAKAKPKRPPGFTVLGEFGLQSDVAAHPTPEEKVETTAAYESIKAQLDLLSTKAKLRPTKAFFTVLKLSDSDQAYLDEIDHEQTSESSVEES